MTQQFLDGPQVAAATEKMRRERMPKRVRRCIVAQSQRPTQPLHGELDDAWGERAAFGADE